MLCTLLVVSVLKEAGVYIGVCIHAVGLEFQSFSGYLHLGTILLIPFTPHSHIMHSAPSQFTTLHVRLTLERGWVGNDMYRRGIRCSLALLCVLIHRACP